MNYILQLTGFFNRASMDNRLTPYHISLYVAIFRHANAERFKQPLTVCRQELMKLSKILSKSTYHNCIKDLHEFGYLHYEPSFHPMLGSQVSLIDLQCYDVSSIPQISDDNLEDLSSPLDGLVEVENDFNHASKQYEPRHEMVRTRPLNGTNPTIKQSAPPYIKNKHINNINSKQETHPQEILFSIPKSVSKNPRLEAKILSQIEKLDAHFSLALEEKTFPPTLEMLSKFFVEQNSTFVEAQKFFNHYQSNGWRVGGKAPMVDWKAAASNWLLNAPRFSPPPIVALPVPPTPGVLNTSTLKDYSEPL